MIASTASNEFCVGSPDPNVSGWLENNHDRFKSIIFTFVQYYVSGCAEQFQPLAIQDALNQTAPP